MPDPTRFRHLHAATAVMSDEESGADMSLPVRKWKKADDLDGVKRRQLRAMKATEVVLYSYAEDGDREGVLKASHALRQAAGAYRKTLKYEDARRELMDEAKAAEMVEAVAEAVREAYDAHDVPPSVRQGVYRRIEQAFRRNSESCRNDAVAGSRYCRRHGPEDD